MPIGETIAYLAGLVDGDGYFKITRSFRTPRIVHPYYATVVGVSQLWPGEAVRIFATTFGGVVMDPRKISAGRLMARCEIRGASAESAARRLLPFLQMKRDQAILLLEIGRLRSGRRGRVRDGGAGYAQMELVRQVLRSSHKGTARIGKLAPFLSPTEGYTEPTTDQLGCSREQLLSYLAGIIDSDGNLRIERGRAKKMINPRYRINIRCAQVMPSRAVELLARTFGGRLGNVKSRRANCRDLVSWSLYDKAAESAIQALLGYLVVKKTEALHLLELRCLKAKGKHGLTEWVHANRWRAGVRMRKRCYSAEQIAEFERIFFRVQRIHSPQG